MKKHVMFYNSPSDGWNDALPIGGGKMGAMVNGGAWWELIDCNEDSVWFGNPSHDRIPPRARGSLEEIRQLIRDEEFVKANKLLVRDFFSTSLSMGHYSPLCYVEIKVRGKSGEPKNYIRALDLDNAVSTVEFEGNDGIKHKREFIASFPQNVIAMHLTTSEPCDYCIKLGRYGGYIDSSCCGDDFVGMFASEGGHGTDISAVLRCKSDGEIRTGARIDVDGATDVLLILSGATTQRESSPYNYASMRSQKALEMGWDALLAEHIADYREQFVGSALDITGDDVQNVKTTKELIADAKNGEASDYLIELYYTFCRYLMIASSRPGSNATTLQGIWNNLLDPPWGSRYTININTEMNYWPAEPCGMPTLAEPLFDLIRKMHENGKYTAKKMYGCRGSMCHHNTSFYGDTAPQDDVGCATQWPLGQAWLVLHMWEHFLFDPDNVDFLRDVYPVMRDNALFLCDFMIEDKDGYLVTSPSLSPENYFRAPNGQASSICEGPTMDIQIVRDLFEAVIAACDVLDDDREFQATVREKLAKLPPNRIGKYGQIMEWNKDYDEYDPGHRHIAHLYGLHPSFQINPETPVLYKAARATIERRLAHGGGNTGWSCAWIMNMWARLYEGDKMLDHMKELLKTSTYNNLFDMCPPFQIDGNFGALAGITEALVQSYRGKIILLPALPSRWKDGSLTGIRVRGGGTVSIEWKNGKLTKCILDTKPGREFEVVYGDTVINTVGSTTLSF